MRRIILVLFLLFCYAQGLAQTQEKFTFPIQALENTLFLKNTGLLILHDYKKNLSIQDSAAMQARFHQFNPRKEILQPFETYWVKFYLQSQLDKDTDWVISLGKLSLVDMYTRRSHGKFRTPQRSGQFLPVAERDIKAGRFNTLNLFLPAGETVEIWIRFENKVNYPPDPNLRLINKTYWQDILIKDNLTQGFFHGLLWMMLLYNLLLFVRTGDRAYFYYVVYILTTSIYLLNFYGYWGEFFTGQFPVFNYLYVPFTAYIAFLCYLQFMRYFLDTADKMPAWDTIITAIQVLFLVVSTLQIFMASVDYQAYMIVEKYINSGVFIVLIVILLWMFITGDIIARYFALGTAFMAIGTIILLVGSSKMLNIKYNNLYYQLGIVAELAIFSLGLSERYRQGLRERRTMRNELIYQLEENRNLQTKVNRELEQKVKERTLEIEDQKAKILSQSEEIASQRDLMEEQNKSLEDKNRHITDSIVYASRIQNAILHDYQKIESIFEEGFIFYQPKDIVSGDFYWYNEVNTYIEGEIQKMRHTSAERFLRGTITPQLELDTPKASPVVRNIKFIVVADCTGHGVPGAFMTIMGNSLLNEIIMDMQVTEPKDILKILDDKVVHTLRKQGSNQQIYDGMEISILAYDEVAEQVKFAGTVNPLYLVRDFDIQQVKANRYSIGYSSYHKEKTFAQCTIKLKEDDVFYLASDGFQDQFGGRNGRKYLKKRFREFLLKNSHLPLKQQKINIHQELKNWRGDHGQTDDITIIGLKFQ